jgi:hypothetical protein
MKTIFILASILIATSAMAAGTYRLTNNSLAANAQPIIREADGATIPNAAGNLDYQVFLSWLAASNTPDPAPTLPTPPPTTLAIISTSYASALNGTYAIDPATQVKIQAIALGIAVDGNFPAGLTSMPWPDSSGTLHYFPTTTEFQAFATAIRDYVTKVDLGMPLPTPPVTIP